MTYFGSMNPAVGGSHAAGQPLSDLLQLPLIAVRVGEGRAAEVRAVFRVPACDRALVRVEMPHSADLDTPTIRSSRAMSMSSTTRIKPWSGSVLVVGPLPN